MGAFSRALEAAQPRDTSGRLWTFAPYDQLTSAIGPLSRVAPDESGVIVVETPWKAARRPYHRQKLALVLANTRHFAIEQAERGVAVRHVVGKGPYRDALRPLAKELGPILVMDPAERELHMDLQPLFERGDLVVEPHEGWLTTSEDFAKSQGKRATFRMQAFYERARRRTGILMRDGKPEGGKFSFDVENRKAWKGDPPAPEPPRFEPDEVTREVVELVETRFLAHPGRLDAQALPATLADARALWRWALRECLPTFGPYEDAMSERSRNLFHTRIAAALNLHRLLPADVVRDAAKVDAPIASREGFVRQVLGWREFVRHVHVATDGFRALPTGKPTSRNAPGDGGFARWAGRAWRPSKGVPDGGAAPSALGARRGVPPAFWGAASGMRCLDETVRGVWDEAYSHHITRLMVLSNLATLLGVAPRDLTDWFWVAYADAYDWVVEPNVLGMGTFGAGAIMTTKPYVSGAAYIHRMSDHCGACAFDPKKDCPITPMYWTFLAENADALERVGRIGLALRQAKKRPVAKRRHDAAVTRAVRKALAAGRAVAPETLPRERGA